MEQQLPLENEQQLSLEIGAESVTVIQSRKCHCYSEQKVSLLFGAESVTGKSEQEVSLFGAGNVTRK
jgi:hypothetical protein